MRCPSTLETLGVSTGRPSGKRLWMTFSRTARNPAIGSAVIAEVSRAVDKRSRAAKPFRSRRPLLACEPFYVRGVLRSVGPVVRICRLSAGGSESIRPPGPSGGTETAPLSRVIAEVSLCQGPSERRLRSFPRGLRDTGHSPLSLPHRAQATAPGKSTGPNPLSVEKVFPALWRCRHPTRSATGYATVQGPTGVSRSPTTASSDLSLYPQPANRVAFF